MNGIMAMRLELLNDPALPAGGPGRSLKGTGVLTEMIVEAAPGDGSGGFEAVKIVSATADVNPPERPLSADFDDRTGRNRVTGPIAFAIDGKDETAWDIDVGPGRSNVPRNAVFVFERPLNYPGGVQIKFRLVENHGGWNTDDNMCNNLGRFRFAVTNCPDIAADPVPVASSRGAGHRAREAHARSRRHWFSAIGGRPWLSGARPTSESRRFGSSIQPARRSTL